MARQSRRQPRGRRTPRDQQGARARDNEGIIPVLARKVREIETRVERGTMRVSDRSMFQVVALRVRDVRARILAYSESTVGQRL